MKAKLSLAWLGSGYHSETPVGSEASPTSIQSTSSQREERTLPSPNHSNPPSQNPEAIQVAWEKFSGYFASQPILTIVFTPFFP